MPRQYRRQLGSRTYRNFTDKQLAQALSEIRAGRPCRKVSEKYGIPKSTLNRHSRGIQTAKFGRPTVFTTETETKLAECIALAGDWGFPLTHYDLRLIIKSYLDRRGINEKRFKNNLPGYDWMRKFLERNKNALTQRLCQNIKRCRANVNADMINSYFDELEKSLEGVPNHLVINYDETNLTDDPGRKNVIVRRGCRHPEKIVDSSKSSTSVMFAGTGSGELPPVYIVYKA